VSDARGPWELEPRTLWVPGSNAAATAAAAA
jgi:hypothetical protein